MQTDSTTVQLNFIPLLGLLSRNLTEASFPSGQGQLPANIFRPHLQRRPKYHPGKDADQGINMSSGRDLTESELSITIQFYW